MHQEIYRQLFFGKTYDNNLSYKSSFELRERKAGLIRFPTPLGNHLHHGNHAHEGAVAVVKTQEDGEEVPIQP